MGGQAEGKIRCLGKISNSCRYRRYDDCLVMAIAMTIIIIIRSSSNISGNSSSNNDTIISPMGIPDKHLG